MILSTKHVKLSSTYLNSGSLILEKIDNTQTFSELWSIFQKTQMSYEKFIFSLDFLFLIGLINYENQIIWKVIL